MPQVSLMMVTCLACASHRYISAGVKFCANEKEETSNRQSSNRMVLVLSNTKYKEGFSSLILEYDNIGEVIFWHAFIGCRFS